MKIEHICFIAEGYPTKKDPVFTFFRNTVCSIADSGIKCSVIVPQSISRVLVRNKSRRPFHWVDITKNNHKIDIFQPCYLSFSNINILKTNITQVLWNTAVIKTFEKMKIKPNVLYAHFWHCGITAAIIGKKHGIPVFVASGESRITVRERYKDKVISRYLETINGVICVSGKNFAESLGLKLASEEKMIVLPNAIDEDVFYIENKQEARKTLGFNENDFIVVFTGAFNSRKGVLRLSEAVNRVKDVKTIYIGSGEQKPHNAGILFCGKLPHDQIVHYLNAADVFVLPTLAEGCCNAIIEAMACGLPIISSNLPFNDDILSDENSIRINIQDIDEIEQAIILLKGNPDLRNKMSEAAIRESPRFNIKRRTYNIVEFMELKI